jgi:hypothetical protein
MVMDLQYLLLVGSRQNNSINYDKLTDIALSPLFSLSYDKIRSKNCVKFDSQTTGPTNYIGSNIEPQS